MTAILFVTSGYAQVFPVRAPTRGAVKAGLHGFAGPPILHLNYADITDIIDKR